MGALHEDQYTSWSYLAQLFIEWEMFQTEFVDEIKTHFMCNSVLVESHAIYEIMCQIF